MNDKIRVAMVGSYPGRPGEPLGGPEAVTEVLADGLAATGKVDLHFVTSVSGLAAPEIRTTPAGATIHRLPLFNKLGNMTGFYFDKKRIYAEIRRICPDIVHVHATLMYAHSALERGYPSILAIRGISFRETPFERGMGVRLQAKLANAYERNSIRRAKHIVCLNKYTLRSVEHLILKADVRYIDNPVDDSFFDVPNAEEDRRLFLLALVRRLKGHDYLLRAMGQLKRQGYKLNLYCAGRVFDADFYEDIKRIIVEEGIEDCVFMEGQISRLAAQQHYSKASIVVLPSLVENAPLVVSEAMAAGKAVVATSAGGIAEMIENGKDGIVVPIGDSIALANAIRTLVDDPEKRRAFGKAAKETAEKRFRLSVSVSKTLNYYRKVLGLPDD